MRRFSLIAVPYIWLLALFLIPFLIVLKISLSDAALAIPPYAPQLDFAGGWDAVKAFFADLDFENFEFLTTDDLYWKAYLSSLKIALISTGFTLLIGYPIAYSMARAAPEWRPTLLMLVDPAVLDELPDPRLRMDGHPLQRRLAQPVPTLERPYLRTPDDPQHQHSRLHRHRLHIPAFHDPADLFSAGKDGRQLARSRGRPRLLAHIRLLAGDCPA